MPVHNGGCHCAKVRFEFEAPAVITMTECDCSLCSMTAYQHIFVPQEDVIFLSGKADLTVYTFNTETAKHMFCKHCGIKPLYIPRSHPNDYSINLRCIDPGTLIVSETIQFGGANWEDNIAGLRDKTT